MRTPLDIQSRNQRSGKIRFGREVPTGQVRNGRPVMKPVKLNTLRFTSPSGPMIEAVAALYGGQVEPWDNHGRKEFEVITKISEVMVSIPPGRDIISTWYEWWTAAGCLHRCDSQTDQKTGRPCVCPHAEDPSDPVEVDNAARRRHELSKMQPPQACGLKTRLSLILPDLPDVGVWQVDTTSFYAAGELLGKAQIMEFCRDREVFLPARLWGDHRTEVVGGETRRYVVPALELTRTFREVVTGQLQAGNWEAQLPAAPGALAITAAPVPPVVPPEPEPAPFNVTEAAQVMAQWAWTRAGASAEVDDARKRAEDDGYLDDLICTDPATGVYDQTLRKALQDRFRALKNAENRADWEARRAEGAA